MESFKGQPEAPNTIPLKRPKLPQSSIGVLSTSTDFRWLIGNRGVSFPSSAAHSQQCGLEPLTPSFLIGISTGKMACRAGVDIN